MKDPEKIVREAIRTGKFEVASSDEIKSLRPYVDEILEILGHPEAMVTDESLISDFRTFDFKTPGASDEKNRQWLADISRKLKFEVSFEHSIVFLANFLKNREWNN